MTTEMNIKEIIVTAEIDIAGIGVTLLEEIAEIGNRKGVIETTTDEIGKEIETKDVIEIVIEIEIVEKPGVIGIMIDTRTGKIARRNHVVRGRENDGGPGLVKEIMIEEEETTTNMT